MMEVTRSARRVTSSLSCYISETDVIVAATVGGVTTTEMAVEVAATVGGEATFYFIGHLGELGKIGRRIGRCEYHAYASGEALEENFLRNALSR